MKSERLTILVTPEEKAAMNAKAAEMHVSTSEMLRLAFDAFEEPENQALLSALADELERAVKRMSESLDAASREVEETLKVTRARRSEAA